MAAMLDADDDCYQSVSGESVLCAYLFAALVRRLHSLAPLLVAFLFESSALYVEQFVLISA